MGGYRQSSVLLRGSPAAPVGSTSTAAPPGLRRRSETPSRTVIWAMPLFRRLPDSCVCLLSQTVAQELVTQPRLPLHSHACCRPCTEARVGCPINKHLPSKRKAPHWKEAQHFLLRHLHKNSAYKGGCHLDFGLINVCRLCLSHPVPCHRELGYCHPRKI